MQIFCKSPRQWHAAPFDPAVAASFRQACDSFGMGPVLVHTAYLINLGSADDALWERSWRALADEWDRACGLGAAGLVTHIGTAFASELELSACRVAEAIDRAWAEAGRPGVRLLLENTAAAGTTFGDGPDELGAVLAAIRRVPDVGVCLDTCHAHAAGWDLSRPESWTRLLDQFEMCCERPVAAVHANDSRFGPGKHKDRHAWIGDGTIGYVGFAAMVAEPRLVGLPVVTEMPGEVPEKDVENVSRLKRLRDACVGP
jgi:deoxyribonuclease-4